jgi:hypothetical protein
MHNAKGWLQDCDGDNKIGRQNDVLLLVNSKSMGIEIFAQNVGIAGNILWPFADDIEIIIRLHQPTRRSSHCGTHVCDEEST